MKNVCLVLLMLVGPGTLLAQDSIFVRFAFHNDAQPFALNEVITATNGVDYKVEDLAFYMSRVILTHDGGQETVIDTNEVFYVNFNAPLAYLGQHNITTFESIRFDVGVPAYLNHLDISQYPEDHPLSYKTPTMHWGWSAGYFFLLMHGHGDHNGDGIPTENYQLDCLGDDNIQRVEVSTIATVYPDVQYIGLICNVDEWLRGSNPATTGVEHGSTGINAAIMNNVMLHPVFVAPQNASLAEQQQLNVAVAQSGNDVTLSWGETAVDGYRLIDAKGRILAKGACNGQQLSFSDLQSGWHIVQLMAENDVLMGTAKWIVP